MTHLLGHALHLSWGIVDTVRRLAVLVFAGGVECLVGEDLAGLQVGDDGLPVVDEQFGHAAGVAPADVEDTAHADDVVLRDAAAPVDPADSGPYGDVRSRRFGSFVLGDGLPARRPGAAGRRLAAPLLVEFCLRPGREFGVGQGLALGAVRFSGGSPAERAVRPLLVVDVPEFGELFVELVDRGRQGTGGEPLLQGAVVAFDLALRLGVAGPSVALAHAHQRERAFGTPRGGADRSGGVHGAVVGERPGGDAVFGARLKERGLHVVHRHRGERTRVQQVAGAVVEPGDDHGSRNRGDRPVGEVRLPQFVGQGRLEPRARRLGAFPGFGAHQAGAHEDAVDRGVRRRPDALALQPGGDGFGSGVRAVLFQLFAQLDDPRGQDGVGPVGYRARGAGTGREPGIAVGVPSSFDLVRPLAAHAVAPGRAGHALAVVDRGGESLVAQVLAALRRGRGLIVAGRAGLLPCIHDTTTAANPIVVNQAPGHASTSRSN